MTLALVWAGAHLFTGHSLGTRAIAWGDSDIGDVRRFPLRVVANAAPTFDFALPTADELARFAPALRTVTTERNGRLVTEDRETFLRRTRTAAFLVIKDDLLLYEGYFDSFDRSSTVTSFSGAKSFVSALVGIAIAEGVIDSVEDPITKYVPELLARDPGYARVTLRHLLRMSSGIRYRELGLPWGDDAATYYAPDLRAVALGRRPGAHTGRVAAHRCDAATGTGRVGHCGRPARAHERPTVKEYGGRTMVEHGRPSGPLMSASDAVGLYDLLESEGIEVWIDGGWAVDALLGEQTRSHADLDIALETRFLDRLRKVLAERGFQQVPRDDTRQGNFVLGNEAGLELDVHAFTFDENGDGVYGPPENGDYCRADALTGAGMIDGRPVRCISLEWLVRFHTGYEIQDTDYHDVTALCERYLIELPEEYRHGPPRAGAAPERWG